MVEFVDWQSRLQLVGGAMPTTMRVQVISYRAIFLEISGHLFLEILRGEVKFCDRCGDEISSVL